MIRLHTHALSFLAPSLICLRAMSCGVGALLLCASPALLDAVEDAPTPVSASTTPSAISIQLPSKTDLANLSDLVARFAGVSLKYDPNKLRGNVKLNIQEKLDATQLWDVYNQVLTSQQYATVVTGVPAVYHVVPLGEAAMFSAMLTPEQLVALPFKPSYMFVVQDLSFLAADAAVKSVSALFFGNQIAQVRPLGLDKKRIVITGVTAMVEQSLALLQRIDVAGIQPVIRSYQPVLATPQGLQTSATAAWAALNRLTPGGFIGELQLTPDNTRVLLIATNDTIDALEKLIRELDLAEPQTSVTYTPHFFTIDDVADLIEQIFSYETQNTPTLIRDTLTDTLMVRATAGQHQRIAAMIERLNNVPAEGQQKMQTFVIKHRQAHDLVVLLSDLLSEDGAAAQTQTTAPTPTDDALPTNAPTGRDTQAVAQPPADALVHVSARLPQVRLSTDSHTNSIIAISTPQQLAHIQALIMQLDQRQPQVQLEVIMVNISEAESHELGIALADQFANHNSTVNLSSVFGLSKELDAAAGVATTPDSFAGFAGTVINPGNFASMIRALETVTDGDSIVRSTMVINNNETADVNSVREEPITNFNAGDTFSTTTFSGTLDAGTEITITPHISAADYVSLSYAISQSAFVGESTVTANGGTVPPPKRTDSLTSVATIPDGHIIAVGGLVSEEDSESVSRVPVLGSLPFLGALFRNTSRTVKRTTFHIFIRVNILNHKNFETLRHRSARHMRDARIQDNEMPQLKARFIR